MERLKQEGAEVILVPDEYKTLPGPMWRFIALNDKTLDRIIFRDADSVISTREAKAVEEWVNSNCYFHGMRDSYSHTELILAGLCGVIPKALPDISNILKDYSKLVTNKHFADQYFLREYIWPYFKQSLMQHDSLFGFLDAKPFPDGPMPEDFHVGYSEGSVIFSLETNLPEGSNVQWQFIDKSNSGNIICSYNTQVKDGKVTDCIPSRYGILLEEKKANIVIKPLS